MERIGNILLTAFLIESLSPFDIRSKNHGTHALFIDDANIVTIMAIVKTKLYNAVFSLPQIFVIITLSEDPNIVPARICGIKGMDINKA